MERVSKQIKEISIMSISPNIFLANMKSKGGPAKPSRFEVVIPIPTYINGFIENNILEKILNFPNSIFTDVSDIVNSALGQTKDIIKSGNTSISRYLALQCEGAELPGKSLHTADVKIYGPSFKVPYQVSYEPVSFTFICTNEFEERKLFDRWLEAIMPTDSNNLRFPKGVGSNYMANVKIIQYDDFIKQIYAVELIDAFPIRIASQPLQWSEEGFHRLNVQFAYHKFKTIYEGNFDIGNAASTLLGSAASRLLPNLNTLF